MTGTIKGIVIGLVLGIALTIGTVGYPLQGTNSELKSQIAQRDNLIKRIQASDSLSCQSAARYDSVVTKYVTTDCNLLVDGKELSLDKFIDIYVGQQQRRLEQQTQLREVRRMLASVEKGIRERELQYATTQDSLNLYRLMIRTAKKYYGLSFTTRLTDKYRIVEPQAAQLDSALILLRVFRHQLSYDSLSRRWLIKQETVARLPTPSAK